MFNLNEINTIKEIENSNNKVSDNSHYNSSDNSNFDSPLINLKISEEHLNIYKTLSDLLKNSQVINKKMLMNNTYDDYVGEFNNLVFEKDEIKKSKIRR